VVARDHRASVVAYSGPMPGSILALWPADPRVDVSPQIDAARSAAPERAPMRVLVVDPEHDRSVADVRLDDAASLRSQLGLPSSADDAQILDAAWERWGDRFPEHLVGDFAWAKWHAARQELVLVRDHMGIRPLAYARYRDGFAACSDMRALRALPGVDLRWDELYIAMSFTDIWLNHTSTPYLGITRLPPGTIARVRHEGTSIQVHDHWQLPEHDLQLPTESDYLERFRSLFLEAVACRLPAPETVASELSGGLDSTVVTAALADLRPDPPLLALAASFAEPRYEAGVFDESQHRRWAADDPRIELREVPASQVVTVGAIDRLMAVHGGPVASVMDLVRLRLWQEARARGSTVVFDGFDGDTTVNYGFERLAGLARRGHLITLAKETHAAYRRAGRVGLRETAILLTISTAHALVRRVREPGAVRRTVATRDLLERSGFLDGLRALPIAVPGDVRREHSLDIRSGTIALAIERLDVVACAAGVDVRHPFFDRRLVEFCIALPPDLLFRERMPRWIQRAALEGLGPESVVWRHDKGAMPNRLGEEALDALGASTTSPPENVSSVVDSDVVMASLARWRADRNPTDATVLYPAYTLGRWGAKA
jgi:asparagine synthase (glutamine-hydrolysing)